eukprot:GHVS01075349.1.p1 GENE.GHVS01075349.1~~GHVS01075349.1.p1  ORF type:complete len:189 (-),score=34.32 GHVS01075349.1:3-521(-)
MAVHTAQIEPAIQRFASFFVSPMFSLDAVSREVCAIDSEHAKNVQQDHWRLAQLQRHLCAKDHPMHRFPTGNKNTLLRDEAKIDQEEKRTEEENDTPFTTTATTSTATPTTTANQTALTGCASTIQALRSELVGFYHSHYSANLMKLCVLSQQPLDELQQMVEKYLGAVPNR